MNMFIIITQLKMAMYKKHPYAGEYFSTKTETEYVITKLPIYEISANTPVVIDSLTGLTRKSLLMLKRSKRYSIIFSSLNACSSLLHIRNFTLIVDGTSLTQLL